ncbi:MAG: hypothetical protein AB1778_02725 [Candidatus Bipolaricaulota bacterium]
MKRMIVLCALVAVALAVPANADETGAPETLSVEGRLEAFAVRLRLGLSVAAVAVYSPTVSDAHSQAHRLSTLLRGDDREEIPGLLTESERLPEWVASRPFGADAYRPLLAAAANVHTYLRLAGDAAAEAIRQRTLLGATRSLYEVYAYLVAAWAKPVDGVVVPGLEALLRAFDLPISP